MNVHANREEKEGKKIAMMFPSEQELNLMTAAGKHTSYSYDQVFCPTATQEQVYEETRPLITSVSTPFMPCVCIFSSYSVWLRAE